MGYNSTLTGALRMSPAMPMADLDRMGFGDDGPLELIVKLEGVPATLGLVDGRVAVIEGTEVGVVTPRWDEPFKAYDLHDHVAMLVRASRKYGCKWSGALYVMGEDPLDLSRIRVEKGKVVTEEPGLIWPNGDRGWEV